jgi:hypothetical protein
VLTLLPSNPPGRDPIGNELEPAVRTLLASSSVSEPPRGSVTEPTDGERGNVKEPPPCPKLACKAAAEPEAVRQTLDVAAPSS